MYTYLVKDRRLEWWIALFTFFYGLWIMQASASMGTDAYRVLLRWAPEAVWGYAALGVGGGHCFALYINGKAKWTPFVRASATAMNTVIFGVIATGFFLENPNSTAVVTYTAIGIAALVAFLGAIRDCTRVMHSCRRKLGGNFLDT